MYGKPVIMKKITLLVALSALLASCSEKELIENHTDPTLKITISDSTTLEMEAANASTYNFLGHGYDATGLIFNALSGRARVLDIEKLIELHPSRINSGRYNSHFSQTIAGLSASEMVRFLSESTNSYFRPNSDSSKMNMFCGQLTSAFDRSTLLSDKYTYSLYQEFILQSGHAFNETIDTLKNHLTVAFQTDLQNETAENILLKYGTHVLTGVFLGGKIQVMYKSHVTNADVTWQSQVGLSQAVLIMFGQSMSFYSDTNPLENEEQEAFAVTSGGIRISPWNGTILTDTLTRSIMNITPWMESLNETWSLIDVPESHMIPIYELVSDEAKRATLKSAYNTYFLKSKANLMGL